jgi:uncharacterized membrane protein (UPF0127 family)
MRRRRSVRVLNQTRGTVLAAQAAIADTSISRFIGLLGTRSLAHGHGLWIIPSQGVHTIGMHYAIDIVFLDRARRVLELRNALRPFRITHVNWHADSVLELPARTLEQTATRVGDVLVLD